MSEKFNNGQAEDIEQIGDEVVLPGHLSEEDKPLWLMYDRDEKSKYTTEVRKLFAITMKMAIENGAGEEEREKIEIDYLIEEAKKTMKDDYGIDNLSDKEIARLKEIFYQCAKQFKEDKNLAQEGKKSSWSMFEVDEEAIARWLWELYDINVNEIPRTAAEHQVTERFKNDLRRLREKAGLL
ncbi:hypothetical protein GYA13_02475 [Candidatus Kuenenbacteria bacterium]|nr:hypothetical protein [Candidatus Kuenenbacteria bacterium]